MAKKKGIKKASLPKTTTRKSTVPAPAPQPVLPSLMADESDESEDGIFPIVGIGASAGGLEAFTEMLQTLPSKTRPAWAFWKQVTA